MNNTGRLAKAKEILEGKKITKVSYAPNTLMSSLDWEESMLVIELEGGMMLYASRDGEGNGPGVLFVDSISENPPSFYMF